jgi:exosortase/archaeosortase family protein
MTLVTLAVVFAYFSQPRPKNPAPPGTFGWLKSYGFWRSLILVLSAVPIAILTNAFRVSGTGVLAHYYGTKVADGFFHSFSGWVVYIVAFLLLFGMGWILDRFKPRVPEPLEDGLNESKELRPREATVATAPVVSTR